MVGIGPGGEEFLTGQAKAALEQAQVLCGYTVYVDLVREHFPEKEFLTTPMRKEVDRCRMAFEEAEKGRKLPLAALPPHCAPTEFLLRYSGRFR